MAATQSTRAEAAQQRTGRVRAYRYSLARDLFNTLRAQIDARLFRSRVWKRYE